VSRPALTQSGSLAGQFGQRSLVVPLPVCAPDASAGTTASASGRVLVVEDDHLVAMALEQALLDAGLVVVGIAASADEAVATALGQRPDLAVMDVRLLGARDGVDAAIFNGTGIRCIFATAHSDASTRRRAQVAQQPLGWLAKPYTPRTLVQAVRNDSLGAA